MSLQQLKAFQAQSLQTSATPFKSILEAYLGSYGLLPSAAYKSSAVEGIEFLALQFCKLIGFVGNPNLRTYPFGSFPLGRQSDIDLCFLAPP